MTRDEMIRTTSVIKPGTQIEASVRGPQGETTVHRGRFRPNSAEPFLLIIETDAKVTIRTAYPRVIDVREVQ